MRFLYVSPKILLQCNNVLLITFHNDKDVGFTSFFRVPSHGPKQGGSAYTSPPIHQHCNVTSDYSNIPLLKTPPSTAPPYLSRDQSLRDQQLFSEN